MNLSEVVAHRPKVVAKARSDGEALVVLDFENNQLTHYRYPDSTGFQTTREMLQILEIWLTLPGNTDITVEFVAGDDNAS